MVLTLLLPAPTTHLLLVVKMLVVGVTVRRASAAADATHPAAPLVPSSHASEAPA
jgi:hypothetical protein